MWPNAAIVPLSTCPKVVDKKLVPDEKKAPIIRYVFEQYAQGVNKKEIIDELNRRGVRNRNGNPLTYTTFQHVLHMRTYIGEHIYKGQLIPGCATPIISPEVFDKVQERLKEVAHAPAVTKVRIPYLLQGKIYCGLCGSPMFGESGKSHTGAIHSYYSCYSRKRRHGCHKKNERREEMDKYTVAVQKQIETTKPLENQGVFTRSGWDSNPRVGCPTN